MFDRFRNSFFLFRSEVRFFCCSGGSVLAADGKRKCMVVLSRRIALRMFSLVRVVRTWCWRHFWPNVLGGVLVGFPARCLGSLGQACVFATWTLSFLVQERPQQFAVVTAAAPYFQRNFLLLATNASSKEHATVSAHFHPPIGVQRPPHLHASQPRSAC